LRISRPRISSLAVAIALASASLGMSLGWQVPGAAAAAANTQATELVRLINGTRAADGLAALANDSLLSSLARDGYYRCGDTRYTAISGRARDFATRKYLDHHVRNCLTTSLSLSKVLFVSVLQSDFGFGSVGEIVAMNAGFNATSKTYAYTYKGWTTNTYETTLHAMGTATGGWMVSSTHRSIILGGYNRVGCGGWYGNGGYYYDCLFSIGGGHSWSPPATRAPTKAPAASVPAVASASASLAPATPGLSASPVPDATPSEEVAGIVATSASPTPDVAAAARLESGLGGEGDNSTRDLAVRGGILAGAVLALFLSAGLMLRLLRRGRGGTIA
jgi:uncharacterized protein YkwD